jgi:hypothetical protein
MQLRRVVPPLLEDLVDQRNSSLLPHAQDAVVDQVWIAEFVLF